MDVTLAWDPSPDVVTGYKIYYGISEGGPYPIIIDVGNVIEYTVHNLVIGITYFFVTTCYTSDGIESDPSNEISYIPYQIPIGGGIGSSVSISSPPHMSSHHTTNDDEDNILLLNEEIPPFYIIEPYNCWTRNKKSRLDILREQQIYEEFLAKYHNSKKK